MKTKRKHKVTKTRKYYRENFLRVQDELKTCRELNNELRKVVAQKEQLVQKIQTNTMIKERCDLARSYGQLLDTVSVGLKAILVPGAF